MNVQKINKKLDKIITFIDNYDKKHYTNYHKINKFEFLSNIYHINLLVYNLYKINTDKTLKKNQKIKAISNFTDTKGNLFLNDKMAKYIYENYANNITKIYKRLYKLRINSKKKGYNDILYGGTKETCKTKNCKKYKNILNDFSIINFIENHSDLFNWIFFPLWSLENHPSIGSYVEIPLDIIGVILDFVDIFMEPLSAIVGPVIGSAIDVAQAIPVYGTAVSAFAIPLNFAEEPLQYFVANATDLIGMFINISRKQWSHAYISALECVPLFSAFIDSYLTNVSTFNKHIKKFNKSSYKIINSIQMINKRITEYEPVITNILKNPQTIINPSIYFDKIILPNKHKFNSLKNLSHQDLIKIQNFLKYFNSYLKNVTYMPFIYLDNPDKFYNDIILPYQNAYPNMSIPVIYLLNIVLQNINSAFKLFKFSD